MLKKQMFAISMLLALILVAATSMVIAAPMISTLTKDVTVAQVNDSTLVVSPVEKTVQILAKFTDNELTIKAIDHNSAFTEKVVSDQFTVDAVAISPHTPADFGHVVASIQVDSALKKVTAYTSQMGFQVVGVSASPPTQSGIFFFTSTNQLKWKNFMVAAVHASPTVEVTVIIGDNVDVTGFAIAMA